MKKYLALITWALFIATVDAAQQTELTVRAAHFDRNFENTNSDRTQTGLGLILQHQQTILSPELELNLGAYSAIKLTSTGKPREDLLSLNDGQTSGFSLLGEASLKAKLSPGLTLQLGRMQHHSMLLKSKTRLLPSSFEGVALGWSPSHTHHLYANRYTRWSRRASLQFDAFSNGNNEQIDSISIAGIKSQFKNTWWQSASINAEVLESKNYLRKFGILATLGKQIADTELQIEASVQSSNSVGSLFSSGVERALDSGSQSEKHQGLGAYFTASLNVKGNALKLGVSRFKDPWLEDNFSGDHGTSPFPTRTFGPELSNKNETVLLAEYQHKWRSGFLSGLSSKLAFASGSGAENSAKASLGTAREKWFYAELRYKRSFDKQSKLDARVRYRDYRSDIIGEVAGVASDRHEVRLEISYKLSF